MRGEERREVGEEERKGEHREERRVSELRRRRGGGGRAEERNHSCRFLCRSHSGLQAEGRGPAGLIWVGPPRLLWFEDSAFTTTS